MNNNFVPSFHFDSPDSKQSPEWIKKAIDYCWHNSHNQSLLEGKNLREIEGYANGEYDMEPFKKLHKSAKRKLIEQNKEAPPDSELQFMHVPLIPTKLNSAEATVQKIPMEITCSAIDPLAIKKKQEDINFLKNKPALEEDLQDLADRLQIGKVDLGSTKHSSVPFSSAPYDLDLNEPDELQVFVDLLYALDVEAACETLLEIVSSIKKITQVRLLETKDQFRYAVCSHMAYENSMTGLPDVEYEYPGNIFAPLSDLPDFSDNSHRFICRKVTPLQLFNYFSDEIGSEDQLDSIVNGGINGVAGNGYCACNAVDKKITAMPPGNWNSFKMDLIYCEIISVDSVDVVSETVDGNLVQYFTSEVKKEQKTYSGKVWAQNTYCFWWLKNTQYYFGIHKLGFAHRKKGLESYTNFSSNIYRSQEKGCVEMAIPENKKAQVAFIKMMYALIMSLPAGKVIDLKGMRSALTGLKEENSEYTMETLIEMALQRNQMIIDTEGFDGKNDGQLKPFYEIPGGLKTEITGYVQVMRDADLKISQYTGINEALTGQSASPDALIGLEKLRINQSLNALYYVTAAISHQYQALMNVWFTILKNGIEKGGAVKKAIANMIGSEKVSIIDALDDLPLHTMGVKITISQREEERAKFEQTLYQLKAQGVINTSDDYMLSALKNPRDKFKYLAVKEKQFRNRLDKQRAEDREQQQLLAQQQGQNIVAGKQAEAQGEKELVYAKGDVQSKILQLSSQLGLHASQFQAIIQKTLDQQKQQGQVSKAIQTLQTKHNLQMQEPLQ